MSEALIRRFYGALNEHDGETMAAAYHPQARFRDPAFGELTGAEAGDMWRMLTARGGDLAVELADVAADDDRGSAHWIARYTFSQTGRPVVNEVEATFHFADGLIAEHVDDFSFRAWSRQALGPVGLALGWTPILPAIFRRRARALLAEFTAARQAP